MRGLILLVALIVGGLSAASSAPEVKRSPIVVVLSRSCEQGLGIEVNSTRVPSTDLLNQLGHLVQQHGRSTPVLVLAGKGTSIEDLQNIRAIAGKAGLDSVRFFSFDSSRQLAAEIQLAMLGTLLPELLDGASATP